MLDSFFNFAKLFFSFLPLKLKRKTTKAATQLSKKRKNSHFFKLDPTKAHTTCLTSRRMQAEEEKVSVDVKPHSQERKS